VNEKWILDSVNEKSVRKEEIYQVDPDNDLNLESDEESTDSTPRAKFYNKKTLLEGVRVSLIGTFQNTRKFQIHTFC
jgi:hypothetical protein